MRHFWQFLSHGWRVRLRGLQALLWGLTRPGFSRKVRDAETVLEAISCCCRNTLSEIVLRVECETVRHQTAR
jgi:hypothetical protein